MNRYFFSKKKKKKKKKEKKIDEALIGVLGFNMYDEKCYLSYFMKIIKPGNRPKNFKPKMCAMIKVICHGVVKSKSCKAIVAFDNGTVYCFRFFLFNNSLLFRSYDQSLNVTILIFTF